MPFPISKETRRIWARRIKGFWYEFSHNKIGLVGLAILIVYLIGAITADIIVKEDPTKAVFLAESFAMPEWMRMFPQYKDLPLTTKISLNWEVSQNFTSETCSITAEKNQTANAVVVRYSENGSTLQPVRFQLYTNATWPYGPPKSFSSRFSWKAKPGAIDTKSTAGYSIEFLVIDPNGKEYPIWDSDYSQLRLPLPIEPHTVPIRTPARSGYTDVQTLAGIVQERIGIPIYADAGATVFSEKGNYAFMIELTFQPTTTGVEAQNATCVVQLGIGGFNIPGLVYGLLGCDHLGCDLFQQLIAGIRISFSIGILSAAISMFMGILVGVVAGYSGGFVDGALMRMVDILLCLPVLPLLMALVTLYGQNVYYIVLLIAIFGWQGLSRLIRSQVLSLKEMPFIECARASGGSNFYIMMRHLVPSILPVALASMVLSVPAAILTEAGLSFIGFGDPSAPTWGRMLQRAREWEAFGRMAWWWIIPPGLAITFICVAFVFIGHALDEIVNPRLRRRR